MDPRRRLQTAAVALTTLLIAGCSDAGAYPMGSQSDVITDVTGGGQTSVLRTLTILLILPLVIGGAIAAAAWLPGMVRGSRYRPQYGWSAAPVWFAGPSGDPVAAVVQAQAGELARGGTGGSW